MGKKKPKDPEKGDVFKTLFGDLPKDDASSRSLFSDSNPFRRKPSLSSQTLPFENPSIPDSEVTKRKRTEETNETSQTLEDAPKTRHLIEPKKSKNDKLRNPNLGSESNEELLYSLSDSNETLKKNKGKDTILGSEGNPNSGSEVKEMVDLEKGKEKQRKKRKRDEIEEEYEAQHYGTVAKVEGVGEKRKSVVNPAEMLVSKEGFDDESKLLRTVFVGNLPLKIKKKALLKEFSVFGEVESVRIRSVPILDSKKPRKGAIISKKINDSLDSVHAYIVFKTEESAQTSLSHNMSVIGGNHIRVDRACPPRKKLKGENDASLYDNKRTVFVGNLPFDVKAEEIYQLFCGIDSLESSIEAVRVVRNPHTSVGKGIAYILFKTKDAANLVVKKRNLKLRDRDLRLYHAKPSSTTPSKRRNPTPAEADISPAKKLATGSRISLESSSGLKTKSIISYQGLQASKSGVPKKGRLQTKEAVKLKSKNQKENTLKEQQKKRPAVAARKAKINAVKAAGGGGSKQTGKKRKLDSQTPEGGRRSKKAKKFR
ncbi:hypothetical protein PVL29_002277 [Vitis rotundifolia]|uniref:RRM domain-containing protein n=1 Tax=Vitis rotundifolia TaxID=103349 RepID=A0AA39AJ56_VITRO|nr:hypothetical protein PVL29_002277 [Vitis rotundifolia]